LTHRHPIEQSATVSDGRYEKTGNENNGISRIAKLKRGQELRSYLQLFDYASKNIRNPFFYPKERDTK